MNLDLVPEWLIREFERGEVPTDEPPGFSELAYRAWRDAGGVVLSARDEDEGCTGRDCDPDHEIEWEE